VPLTTNATALGRSIREELATRGDILSDAPDRPVVIRVVATTQPCDEIAQVEPGDPSLYVGLDARAAVGCAYSCPVLLDEVTGSISVSLDALDDRCEASVAVCAAFPRF
ncbi:MAG: hypothetical protein H0X17_07800, partial [Deltaproteobacteria bacterium]|nr:hypothetical protein [Deltaproteobacteria bacterium]